MRVKFIEDFRWKPTAGIVIRYKSGTEMSVTRACVDRAFSVGKAIKAEVKSSGKNSKNSEPIEAGKKAEPTAEGS